MTALTNFRPNVFATRPGLLGRSVFDDVLGSLFSDSFPTMLRQSTQGYPVADIYRNDGGDTVMEFALAGFNKEDIKIIYEPGSLVIESGDQDSEPDEPDLTYLHKGIALRRFVKRFTLSDAVIVVDSQLEDGMLTIHLEKHIPDELKPKLIEIN